MSSPRVVRGLPWVMSPQALRTAYSAFCVGGHMPERPTSGRSSLRPGVLDETDETGRVLLREAFRA